MIRLLALAFAIASATIWLLIGMLADSSVRRAIHRDAVDTALNWAEYAAQRVPDMRGLVRTGMPTPEQQAAIAHIRQLGDVFRFKLFDAQGRLVMISDTDTTRAPQGAPAESDPEASRVIQTGAAIVEAYDGTEKPNRPDLYAEAYVPLFDPQGAIFGVAEVYTDQTQVRSYFTDSFRNFGLMVSAICAGLLLVPVLGYALQRRLAQRSQSEAAYLANYDPLTGLLNRAEFTRRAARMIETGGLAALLFIDVDKFKSINDTQGHAVGDRYLAQIGRILSTSTDARDIVSRFGGDEFVVAMTGIDRDTAIRRVREIQKRCAEPLDVGDKTVASSISTGMTVATAAADLDEALAQADAALYYAKSAGRNQYAVYGDDMGAEIRRRNRMEARILNAANTQGFKLAYQPLIDARDHRPIGYEALLRLEGEDGTIIAPGEFIPLAEDMGLIEEIGTWVIQTATRDIAALPGTPKVAINLSALQFRSGRLPTIVADALAAADLSPDRLELEITESLLMDDDASVAFQIDAIRETGVHIAMDDFGTGFSSLGYLWRYGFDRIKIDRSFVAGLIDTPERSLEIIETVILLGKRLGMKVTAEGVETAEQSALLSELGCDVLQGYKFGAPSDLPDETGAGNRRRRA